jgi:hypothetical protein
MRVCVVFSRLKDIYPLSLLKQIYSILFLSGVALFTTGCSSYPAQPQFSPWNTEFGETAASSSYAAPLSVLTSGSSTEPGWGAYSGARGLAVPQGSETYVYRGDHDQTVGVTRAQM